MKSTLGMNSRRIALSAALLSAGIISLCGQDPLPARPGDRIRAFCVDFNWGPGGPNGFPAPGTFAQADPVAHYQWYRKLGVNVIQTFCVSCNGYAWYQGSEVAPVQPGLKHDFLRTITDLAHRDGIKVMGYFCVGANTYWGQKHPEQSYGIPSSIHIPFTSDYLDYLTGCIKDALTKTGIDGFMIDWAFSPPLLMDEKTVRWLPCEQKMYAELFNQPFPGKDQIDAPATLEFQRRALDRCWRRIRAAAKAVNPECVIWLSCFDLSHPQVVGTDLLRQVDWVMNETPTPEKLDATRLMVGPNARLIQCVSGGSTEYDASKVLDNPKYKEVGLYGFAPWPDPETTLPPETPQDATQKNIRANIEKLRRVFLAAPATTNSAKPTAQSKLLVDKTLVAWVAPANLTQRGGSALTLDDQHGHFDAIVFGELAPAKWMAGSDFFNRTQRDQAPYPSETADANTLVQIAIVYQGKHVTVFRNGKEYARHEIGQPQSFGSDSVIVIGLRHLQATDRACFAGAIEDARLYSTALTPNQIAALKPNETSDPEPLAWWDFDKGRTMDRMGNFTASTLVGNARIADGRLHLDGKGTYLVAARTAPASSDHNTVNASARALRERLLTDPFRPGYHFVTPEGSCMPFDPNGAVFWKGRYHLFYIFQDHRGHNWGHVSSTDLFHWRHHPTSLTSGMFSGNCFINRDGRPTICYHQVGQGNAMAVALDDDLNEWQKLESNPITPKTQPGDPHHDKYRSWDPYGWLEGETYYAIFGGERPAIAKAPTLAGVWRYVGDLMANAVEGVPINEDVSCADFFPLGNVHMLLCISHRLGCRYYLGQWKNEQFHPSFHEKMSWVDNSFFAPESLLDDRGRRIMWAWVFDRPGFKMRQDYEWSGTMSLPRVLSLGPDGRLRMDPPAEIEALRYNRKQQTNLAVEAESELVVGDVHGNSIELALEMTADGARQFGLKIACSPHGEEQTLIYYDAAEKQLKIDTTRSSLTEAPLGIEAGPLELKPGEGLRLRVFLDRSIVEVFANSRQAVMRRIYPSRSDSTRVVLFSKGAKARVASLDAWDMAASNPF